MLSPYKERILKELDTVPAEMIPKLYRIIRLLTTELMPKSQERGKRGSLRGIWKGSEVDEALFQDARKSLFTYEHE